MTVVLPDRRGNNRIDSLRNIVRDPRVALLFLIPGSGATMRINGRTENLPTPGQMLAETSGGKIGGAAYDAAWPACAKATLRRAFARFFHSLKFRQV